MPLGSNYVSQMSRIQPRTLALGVSNVQTNGNVHLHAPTPKLLQNIAEQNHVQIVPSPLRLDNSERSLRVAFQLHHILDFWKPVPK
jgi:hypothetical protein